MALDPTLVKTYSCASQGETDSSSVGGAEDTTTAIGFAFDPSGNKYDIRYTPSAGISTLNTVRYRDGAGIIQTVTANNSTTSGTWVQFVMSTGYRLLSWVLTSPSAGIYDLGYDTGNPATSTVINSLDQSLPAYKMRRLFIAAFASDLISKTYYDKTFWHNHNVGTLLTPTYRITSDPGVMIRQGLAASLNDTATVQRTGGGVPAGITFVDDNIDQVGADLPSGSGQGIWWEMAAAISNPAKNTSFTSQVTFSGT